MAKVNKENRFLMETQDVLIVGSILLCCACLGLGIAHLSSPVLKGLRWLAGSFSAGTLGVAVILAIHAGAPPSYLLIANTLILLAYVALHFSILEITGNLSPAPTLGMTLLVVQATLYPLFQWLHRAEQLSLVTLGALLAVQALYTVVYLRTQLRKGMAASIWMSIVLLTGFAGFNIFRAAALLVLGIPADPHAANPFEVTAGIVFLATALGLGFSVFWMASMQLRLDLERLANIDPLTGLFNRRSFLAHCEQELQRSERSGEPVSLALVDLDHFKRVNDLHGHDAGDAALCAVANQLKGVVRDKDILGRWGGEEFIVLLPSTSSEQAMTVARRLQLCVESISLPQPGECGLPIRLAISAGVATATGSINSIGDFIRSCDEALYCAKAAGRNTVVQRHVGSAMQCLLPSISAGLPATN